MSDIKKILVPVDFSANSDKLIDYAASYAAKFSASLSLLNVIEKPMAYDGFGSAKFEEEMKAVMEGKMGTFMDEYQDKCDIREAKVVIGDTVDTILESAKDYDMIIIGTHGYRGLEKILMGSVAERVVKNSPCPVLVYNPYK
ncbi:MAG: universal stress protein [Proteobacteria bacterium]|nr:universal stress protein [Pseudomonadota bacterium]MBU0967289.1 universal stress protein [Pseudomonadota bacterium]